MESETAPVKPKKKLSSQQWKYISSIVIMLAVSGLAVYYVLMQGDAGQIVSALGEAKSIYVFAMVATMCVSFVLEGLALTVLSRLYRHSYRLYQGVLNGMIGNFFSAITPFASGGQFVQAYTFSRQGIKPADSASILVMLFIVSQSMIILYGTLALIFGWNLTVDKMSDLVLFNGAWVMSPMVFSLFGYCMNFFSLAILLIMAYCRPIHRFVLTNGVNIGAKLHLIKDPERKKASLAAQVATFRIELGRLLKNAWVFFLVAGIEFVKFTCTNLIPYLAGLALGADMTGKFWACLWSNSYLSMITCFIPIPGASGGAEAGFQLLFSSVYGTDKSNITSAANLLTRGISFYFSLFLGFIVFVFYRASPKKQAYTYDNRKTFVDLQIISAAEGDPALREVTIVPFDEKADETKTTASLAQKDISEQADAAVELKPKKRIWPWQKKKRGKVSEPDRFLNADEVNKSFEDIKKTLIFSGKNVDEDSDVPEADSYAAKESLKKVYEDVDTIEKEEAENNKTDTEIQRAIKADLEALKNEQDKKTRKRLARQQRRIARQERKAAKEKAKEAKAAQKKANSSKDGENK